MKFFIDIAVLHVLFYFIWNYIFTFPLAILFTVLKMDRVGYYILKSLGAYLFASLSSLIVLGHGVDSSIMTIIFFAFVALILMELNLISATGEAMKSVQQEFDFFQRMKMKNRLSNDWIFWLVAAGVFILVLLVPIIGINPLTEGVFYIMDWLLGVKILGTIIKILAVILLFAFAWKGILGAILIYSMWRTDKDDNETDIETSDIIDEIKK